jgi:hypothetical protein
LQVNEVFFADPNGGNQSLLNPTLDGAAGQVITRGDRFGGGETAVALFF